MKHLVAVLGCEREPFLTLEKSVRETWAGHVPDEFKVLFYYGKAGEDKTDGDRVYVNCADTMNTMTEKGFLFFEKMLSEYADLEIVFFTNLSSYVRLDRLVDIFKGLQRKKLYSGFVGHCGEILFASGAGLFISRDLLQLLVDNKEQVIKDTLKIGKETKLYQAVGDVAIGLFLMKRGIDIIPQRRLDVESVEKAALLKKEDVQAHYHFRCKQTDRNNDVVVMRRIHSLLKKEGN